MSVNPNQNSNAATRLKRRLTRCGAALALGSVLALGGAAHAANILIVNNSGNPLEPNVPYLQSTCFPGSLAAPATDTVTIVADTAASPLPVSLAGYDQIWDLRYTNLDPLSAADQSAYTSYLQGGGRLFLMGEYVTYAPARDASILSLVNTLGGGALSMITSGGGAFNINPATPQTVQAPFNTVPNAMTTMVYADSGGVASPGTGQWITYDAVTNLGGSAIAWPAGTLANARDGSLSVVFDINFLQNPPNSGSTNNPQFLQNLCATVASAGNPLEAVVSISKTASTQDALATAPVIYELVVTNTSATVAASNVVVTDPIPAGIASYAWNCAATGGAACPRASANTALNESIGALPPNSSVTYTITATPAATLPAVVTNAASVDGDNMVCASGTPQPPCTAQASNPSLANMKASATPVRAPRVNTQVTATLTCANAGPGPAENAACTITGAPASATTTCSPAAPVALLAANTSIICTTKFTPDSTDPVTLTATATSDTSDPDSSDNSAQLTITPTLATVAETAPIPALGDMALILLAALLGLSAVALRRWGP